MSSVCGGGDNKITYIITATKPNSSLPKRKFSNSNITFLCASFITKLCICNCSKRGSCKYQLYKAIEVNLCYHYNKLFNKNSINQTIFYFLSLFNKNCIPSTNFNMWFNFQLTNKCQHSINICVIIFIIRKSMNNSCSI
jgi:hypothetical protein